MKTAISTSRHGIFTDASLMDDLARKGEVGTGKHRRSQSSQMPATGDTSTEATEPSSSPTSTAH